MVKHIVIWKLKSDAEGNDIITNAKKAKTLLENLQGKIPGLKHVEVGINIIGENNSGDICLYSEFETLEDLEKYHNHPEHLKIIPFMKRIRAERYVMDYTTQESEN